ncbi:MAG: hypothetical protein ACUVXJ_13270 [Phycisphaerae bacterium]
MAKTWITMALIAAFMTVSGGSIAHSANGPATAVVEISPEIREMPVWPEIIGINLDYGGAAALSRPEAMEAVKKIGIKSIRFPNGCEADRYDWKADNKAKMTIEQFLAFCEAVGAEPYYTLNLQGGTEGLPGPPPTGAPVAEIIRYRHTAPNPCGYTDYHFGTLAETLDLVRKYTIERALAGRLPITCYEMGNENWGQAATDWPPEHYAATVAAYAQAMRQLVAEAAAQHPAIKDLKLWITAVGYPLMGNNQDPLQAINHDINVRWTRELNQLYDAGLIDAVQDHFYPYSIEGTDLLVWSHHNLQNILYGRRGVANPGLGGYRQEAIAYRSPIEITEWNLKCWGKQRKSKLDTKNLDFEEGMIGWRVAKRSPGSTAALLKEAGRRGSGLRLQTDSSADSSVTVWQVFGWNAKNVDRINGSVWIRTPQPDRITARLNNIDAQSRPAEPLSESDGATGRQANHWHKIVFTGKVPQGASHLAVSFTLSGTNAQADIDAVELYYWDNQAGMMPAAADTAAQQLLLVDAFRVMIAHGIRRAHLHHLFGAYPCGIMYTDGRTKDNHKVFEFYAGGLGTHTVRTDVTCGTFDFDSQGDKYATAFNALAPDVKSVPIISALAMRDENSLYVVVVNRSTDEPVELALRIRDAKPGPGFVRTLSCTDTDLPGIRLTNEDLSCGPPGTYRMPAHSACLFKFAIGL